jgi:hypothetical protein
MARSGNDMDSASCQFFLCCDESPAVWNLDGGYSSFGRLTAGVATLEAIAEVPVRALTSREVSSPMKRIVIEDAEVVEGPAPTGETIARPAPEIDLGGEPERVVIQHILLTCQGSVIQGATRTVAEAEALANELLAALREGADMDALVREHSDDNVIEGDETPGQMTILNNNVRDSALERESYRLFREFDSFRKEHVARLRSGEIDEKTYAEEGAARKREYLLALDAVSAMQRGKTSVAFGNVAFSLDVGEFGLAAFDPQQSQFGFHVVRRVE